MNPNSDIFTKRGLDPAGAVVRAQGFLRYAGDTWRERRAVAARGWEEFNADTTPPGADPDPLEADGLPSPYAEPVRPKDPRRSWSSWLQMAFSVDGWLMPRHAVLPEDPDWCHAPAAQVRPDREVSQGSTGHDHRRMSAMARYEHEAKAHGGLRVHGWHRHPKTAKYLYTPGNTARRMGTNPVALERGWGTPDDLFVFVMEGTLKMCAVVEAGYPAVDVGSVTLWRGGDTVGGVVWDDDGEPRWVGGWEREIDAFAARHLPGRTVAVVCDSDWSENAAVREQTEAVVATLESHGAGAVGCAPPAPADGKRGIDDWLGEGEDLLDIMVPGSAELTADDPRLEGIRADGRETMVALLTEMGRQADARGVAAFRKNELARAIERAKESVERAYFRAVERGLATEMTEAERRGEGQGMTAPLAWLVEEARPRPVTLRSWLGL